MSNFSEEILALRPVVKIKGGPKAAVKWCEENLEEWKAVMRQAAPDGGHSTIEVDIPSILSSSSTLNEINKFLKSHEDFCDIDCRADLHEIKDDHDFDVWVGRITFRLPPCPTVYED